MTYRKPELNILGEAAIVIESVDPKPDIDQDLLGDFRNPNAAYDLDE